MQPSNYSDGIYSYCVIMCTDRHTQIKICKRDIGSPSLKVNLMSVAALKMRDRVEKEREIEKERVRKG